MSTQCSPWPARSRRSLVLTLEPGRCGDAWVSGPLQVVLIAERRPRSGWPAPPSFAATHNALHRKAPLRAERTVAVHGYPLFNVFWTLLYLFVWILWIFLLVRIITDVFRSHDLTGWGKAGWTLMLIIFPFFGALVYLIFRGSDMHYRENRSAIANENAVHRYLQQVTGSEPSTADELAKLASLRDLGVLTEEEFAAQKAKLLG